MATVIRKSGNGLEKLQQNLQKLQNTTQVSWTTLFNPRFMQKHTDHQTMEDMFKASGYSIESKDDFLAIPDAEWNAFVQKTTRFTSWEEMQRTAGLEFASETLHAGLRSS